MYEKQDYEVIGHSRPRNDAPGQVTGTVQYVCDLHLPGMLYAKPVLSTEHHARILSIDASAALALPGVHCVATSADAPDYCYGVTDHDSPCLAVNKVRYKGEMVACVAAESYALACKAASLVKVEYERLPAVFDPRDALKPGAPVIHDECQGTSYEGNLLLAGPGKTLKLRVGDVDKGFAESDVILEREFCTNPQKPLPIEPFATLAAPDDEGGLTVWSTQQCVFGIAEHVASIVQLPMSKVRMVAPAVGGGFGEKNQVGTEPVTALLAKLTNRPVKLELTTEESLMFTGTKHPMYFTYKLGAKRDGTLVALKWDCVTGCGAYSSVAKLISGKVAFWGAGPYLIPNQWSDVKIACTNKQIGSAMRGFGMGQPTFALEVLMDMLAEELGMDPLELRKKNMFRDGEHMSTGQAIRASGIGLCLDKVAEASGWGK